MRELSVGQTLEELMGAPDQARLEISQGQALLVCALGPERARALAGRAWGAAIKLFREGEAAILLVSLDGGPWMEAVLRPREGWHPARERRLGDAIALALCETGAGTVLAVREIALPAQFGDALRAAAQAGREPFAGGASAQSDLERALMRYNTAGLVERARAGCEVAPAQIRALDSTRAASTGRRAYAGLPAELEPFYVYLDAAGHTLYAIPESLRAQMEGPPEDYQAPLPVRYVLEQGYQIEDGLLFCDVEYDCALGAMVPEGYDEY